MSKKSILEKILPTIPKKENNQEKEEYQFSKTTPNFLKTGNAIIKLRTLRRHLLFKFPKNVNSFKNKRIYRSL